MSRVKDMAPTTTPDWCNGYLSSELTSLNQELDDLNEQVRKAQNKIKEVEELVSVTKSLRGILLTSEGEPLYEATDRVLALLGWKVTRSKEDKQEYTLEGDEKNVLIARVVSVEGDPDRTHLGQLSIAQTRYWCEQGVEPKGMLIVSKSAGQPPECMEKDSKCELNEYANKKNVCLLTTAQLLEMYRNTALHDGKPEQIRNTVMNSSGWLKGYNLSDDTGKKEEGSNKLSSLLSA